MIRDAIKRTYESYGYVMDTHTAVAQQVYEKYKKNTGDTTVTLLAATASPYKFAPEVYRSITGKYIGDAFCACDELSKLSGTPVPQSILELKDKPVLHNMTLNKDELEKAVYKML